MIQYRSDDFHRVFQNLLALLALILRRDLELFDLATRSRLHIEELWDAADSILLVSYAVYSRYQDLVGMSSLANVLLSLTRVSIHSAIPTAETRRRASDENNRMRACEKL